MFAFTNYLKVNKHTPVFIILHSIIIFPILAMVSAFLATLQISIDANLICDSSYKEGDKSFINAYCLTSSLSTNISTNHKEYYTVDHR